MPHFVVLTHDHPFLHWDLMVEQGDVLRTWRLKQPPDAEGPIVAEALPDHRLAYLDYEGPVRGGRGTVERWDAGTYDMVELTRNRVTVRLNSGKLDCVVQLKRRSEGAEWVFQRLPAPRRGS
jgi:hypothetical protein